MKKYFTKISSKGQVTIPKKIRDFLGVKPGDTLEFDVVDGNVIVRLSERPSNSILGIGLKVKEKLGLSAADLVYDMRREDLEEE
jgi:AbrB family looped-hinge helix DNA binding protein